MLNLAAALGQQTPADVNTTVPGTFQVGTSFSFSDVIFKNQAMNQKTPGQISCYEPSFIGLIISSL
jgi:hypothetical protein